MNTMNRHRAYWSAMGLEPSTEQSQLSKEYERLRKELQWMIGRFGKDEVVKELIRIIESE